MSYAIHNYQIWVLDCDKWVMPFILLNTIWDAIIMSFTFIEHNMGCHDYGTEENKFTAAKLLNLNLRKYFNKSVWNIQISGLPEAPEM